MSQEEFLFRTEGLFEEGADSVVCGPLVRAHFKDSLGELKDVLIRKVEMFTRDGEYFSADGVWVEESVLEPLEEDDDVIGYEVGKHIRTAITLVAGYEVVLAEYSDRLQVAVRNTLTAYTDKAVLFTGYFKKIHYGTIKLLIETIRQYEDVEEFVEKLKEIKL